MESIAYLEITGDNLSHFKTIYETDEDNYSNLIKDKKCKDVMVANLESEHFKKWCIAEISLCINNSSVYYSIKDTIEQHNER